MRTYVGLNSFQQSKIIVLLQLSLAFTKPVTGVLFHPCFACCRKERFPSGALR